MRWIQILALTDRYTFLISTLTDQYMFGSEVQPSLTKEQEMLHSKIQSNVIAILAATISAAVFVGASLTPAMTALNA
ncbi:hypothetical protein A8B75_03845 [Sphingomonadales bacterium EhC05]|nr:hypothetical protein A8B75_03845 [Sphingomonadales bacterium EhC05]